MTPQEMFEIIDAAGVSVADFGRLIETSRTTLYRWKAGGESHIRDQLRLRLATEAAHKIRLATKGGKLPLKNQYGWSERLAVLKRILG